MTIKQRYHEAVGLLRLLRRDSRPSCDVVFVSPHWKSSHAAHSHIISLASRKLADDLIKLREISDGETSVTWGVEQKSKLVIDVPGDVAEEAFVLFLDYLYCIEEPTENHGLTCQIAPTLLHLAIHYCVRRLVDDIEEFFMAELSQINLLQYHDIALEASLIRLLKSCRCMLAYSPRVIDRGLRTGEVDSQQIRDILELTSFPLREPDLFRAFLAWLHLQEEDEQEKFKEQFMPLFRVHDLLKTDEDRNVLEDSGLLSKIELAFVLNQSCCKLSQLFAHDRRTFNDTICAEHSRWGVFTAKIIRLDFVHNLVRRFSRATGFRSEMVVLNHDGVDISEEPGRTIESYGLTPQSKLSIFILLRLRVDHQDRPDRSPFLIRVPPGCSIAYVASTIAIQLSRDPRQAEIVDDVIEVCRLGVELSHESTIESCGIVFDDALGYRSFQRLSNEGNCPSIAPDGVLHFTEKTFRNLKWTGHVQFPDGGGLIATLRCLGVDTIDVNTDLRNFHCHVSWIRLTSGKGRVISVETPSVPFVLSNDVANSKSLQVSVSSPFSLSELTKMCSENVNDSSNNNDATGIDSSRFIELNIDFSISEVDWYGGWQL